MDKKNGNYLLVFATLFLYATYSHNQSRQCNICHKQVKQEAQLPQRNSASAAHVNLG